MRGGRGPKDGSSLRIINAELRGVRDLSLGAACLFDASAVSAVPEVHHSRVTRELSHVTRSLPRSTGDQHQRAPTGPFIHARSYYGALQCRTETLSVPVGRTCSVEVCLAFGPNKLPLLRVASPFRAFELPFSLFRAPWISARGLELLHRDAQCSKTIDPS